MASPCELMASPDVQMASSHKPSVPRGQSQSLSLPLSPSLSLSLTHLLTRPRRWRWRGRGCAAFTMCMRAYSRCHCRAAVVGSGQLARMVTSSVPRSLAAGIAWHMPQLHPRLRLALRLQRWRSWRGRGCGRSFYHVHESLQSMPLRLWPAQGSSHAW